MIGENEYNGYSPDKNCTSLRLMKEKFLSLKVQIDRSKNVVDYDGMFHSLI